MTHSKIHQRFSKRLEQPDALTNPEKYLGPNWEDVLNFWIYIDTLSEQEREEMDNLYWNIDGNVRESASIAAINAAGEVVGFEFRRAAWSAAANVTGRTVFESATCELIGSHKLLEQGKTLLSLQYCTKNVIF